MKALIIGCVYYYTFSGVSVIFQIGTWNTYPVLKTALCTCYLFFDPGLTTLRLSGVRACLTDEETDSERLRTCPRSHPNGARIRTQFSPVSELLVICSNSLDYTNSKVKKQNWKRSPAPSLSPLCYLPGLPLHRLK